MELAEAIAHLEARASRHLILANAPRNSAAAREAGNRHLADATAITVVLEALAVAP